MNRLSASASLDLMCSVSTAKTVAWEKTDTARLRKDRGFHFFVFFQDTYIEGVDDFSSGMAFLKQLYDLPRSAVAAVSRQRSCALYISHALRDARAFGGKPAAFTATGFKHFGNVLRRSSGLSSYTRGLCDQGCGQGKQEPCSFGGK